jgi:anti-sigma B factor antagonist
VVLEQAGTTAGHALGALVDHRLAIEVIPNGHELTLVLHGEMDQNSIGGLRACLDELDSQWRSVVLEMARVSFIDSSGIGLLLEAQSAFGVDLRKLELRHVDEQVRRVLELTGATEFIPVASAID